MPDRITELKVLLEIENEQERKKSASFWYSNLSAKEKEEVRTYIFDLSQPLITHFGAFAQAVAECGRQITEAFARFAESHPEFAAYLESLEDDGNDA